VCAHILCMCCGSWRLGAGRSAWRALPRASVCQEAAVRRVRERFLAASSARMTTARSCCADVMPSIRAAAFAAWIEGLKTTFWTCTRAVDQATRQTRRGGSGRADTRIPGRYAAAWRCGTIGYRDRGDKVVFSTRLSRSRTKEVARLPVWSCWNAPAARAAAADAHIGTMASCRPIKGRKLPLIRRLLGCPPEEEAATARAICVQKRTRGTSPRCGQGELVVRRSRASDGGESCGCRCRHCGSIVCRSPDEDRCHRCTSSAKQSAVRAERWRCAPHASVTRLCQHESSAGERTVLRCAPLRGRGPGDSATSLSHDAQNATAATGWSALLR